MSDEAGASRWSDPEDDVWLEVADDAEQAPTPASLRLPWRDADTRRFVGRERVLGQLRFGWQRALGGADDGRVHIVEGERGSGVSSVLAALADEARDGRAQVVVTRCPPVGGAYRMWEAVAHAALQLSAPPDPIMAGAVLRGAAVDVLGDAGHPIATELAALFGYMDEVTQNDRAEHAGATEAAARASTLIARFVAALTDNHPVLFVVDEAGRASRASLAVAAALNKALSGLQAMVVLGGGPGLSEAVVGLRECSRVRLQPLSSGDSAAVCDQLLEGVAVTPDQETYEALRAQMLDLSGGNPAVVENLVAYLYEAGFIRQQQGVYILDAAAGLAHKLPDDYEGLVLARLGALSQYERAVLARASVVGKRFWLGALVALERRELDVASASEQYDDGQPGRLLEALGQLVRQRIVVPTASGLQGEQAWSFASDAHAELADAMLPEATKAELHATVEQWLALQLGFRHDELLLELARHATQAGGPRRAAGYMLQAARALNPWYAPAAIRAILEQARELSGDDDAATCWSILWDLGESYSREGSPEEALQCYREAMHLAWKLRHRGKGAASLARIGALETERGNYAGGDKCLHSALDIFRSVGDEAGVAECLTGLGRLLWLTGKLDESHQHHHRAGAIYKRLGRTRGVADAVQSMAMLHHERGDWERAEAYFQEVLGLCEKLGDDQRRARVLNNLAVVRMTRSDLKGAVDLWRQALELAERLTLRPLAAAAKNNLGEACLALGRLAEAEVVLTEAVELAEELEQARTVVDGHINLARLRLRQGQLDVAEAGLERARERASALGLPRLSARVDRAMGDLLRHRMTIAQSDDEREGAGALAAGFYQRAVDTLRDAGFATDAASGLEALAETYTALGRPDEAQAMTEMAERLRNPESQEG